MTLLFDRRILVEIQPSISTISGRRKRVTYQDVVWSVRDLRVNFQIERDLTPDPDRAEIQLYNYNPTNWTALKEGDLLTVKVGYVEQDPDGTGTSLPVFYKGNITFISSPRRKADRILKISCGDGDKFSRESRISDSFSGSVGVSDVIDKVVEGVTDFAVDLAEGFNSSILALVTGATSEESTAPSADSGSMQAGRVLEGQVKDLLTDVVGRQGADWSIQNNTLVVIKRNSHTLEPPIVLSPTTGLIGSPTKNEDGGISAQSFIIDPLVPGRRIDLQSDIVSGIYTIQRISYSGDTHGSSWYANMEAIPQAA